LYCIVLHCIVLCCNVLYWITLYCIVLHCIALYCIVLYCIVTCCIVLHCIVFYCVVYMFSIAVLAQADPCLSLSALSKGPMGNCQSTLAHAPGSPDAVDERVAEALEALSVSAGLTWAFTSQVQGHDYVTLRNFMALGRRIPRYHVHATVHLGHCLHPLHSGRVVSFECTVKAQAVVPYICTLGLIIENALGDMPLGTELHWRLHLLEVVTWPNAQVGRPVAVPPDAT